MGSTETINRLLDITENVLNGKKADREDGLFLMGLSGNDVYEMFHCANKIKNRFIGPEVSLCGIISVQTGKCSEDCSFCAQSAHYNTNISQGTASSDEIINAAQNAADNGAVKFGLVSSGKKLTDDDAMRYEPVVKKVYEDTGINCCGSLGCLDDKMAQRLYDIGIRHYNHNLETSRRYFKNIVTTHKYDDRIATVKAAKKAGMDICCGGIIGLGETIEDRVDLAIELRDLEVDMVPLNFLNPIEGTPLSDSQRVEPLEALQTIAMFRIILPDIPIKIAGGREDCLRDMQSWMFYAGASSTMVGNYLTIQGQSVSKDLQMIKDLQLPVKQ